MNRKVQGSDLVSNEKTYVGTAKHLIRGRKIETPDSLGDKRKNIEKKV